MLNGSLGRGRAVVNNGSPLRMGGRLFGAFKTNGACRANMPPPKFKSPVGSGASIASSGSSAMKREGREVIQLPKIWRLAAWLIVARFFARVMPT